MSFKIKSFKNKPVYVNDGFQIEKGDVTVSLKKSSNSITYSWHNVNVFASPETGCLGRRSKVVEEKHILKDVTGICRPGELLAIMGASGAGKTSLLNVLTGKSGPTLRITGDLFVNGNRMVPSKLTARSAYVQQDDLFIGTLTVKEALVFQARLRMDKEIPMKMRMARVEEVMSELGLTKCQDTLIGIAGRLKGISGGETKRLAFACEVLTDPPLMFCDEPTSGLDSFMAENIVSVMKSLALEKGKTVISTIHQPSSEVFALFDRVLLMAEGRVAYLGDTSEALKFFQRMDRVCPKNYNPADFFIGMLAIDPEAEAECKVFVAMACDVFLQSDEGRSIEAATRANKTENLRTEQNEKVPNSPYKAGWLTQFSAVLHRSFMENIREPMVTQLKIGQAIFLSLLLGLIYLGQDPLTQDGVSNINGALFLFLTQMSFSNTFGVVNAFCAEVPVFLREHYNGMYRVDVYFLAKNLAELPLIILQPAIFTSVYYYMVGFNPQADNFFICMGIILLVSNCAVSFGYLVSCMSSSVEMALALSAPLLIPLMLFGGFFLNSDSIPVYFIWLKYISWFNYGNEALIINQWQEYTNISCDPDPFGCKRSGDEVITSLGYDKANLGFDLGILAVLLVSMRLLGFIILLAKTSKKN